MRRSTVCSLTRTKWDINTTQDSQKKEESSFNHGKLNESAITRFRKVEVFEDQITAYVWDVN